MKREVQSIEIAADKNNSESARAVTADIRSVNTVGLPRNSVSICSCNCESLCECVGYPPAGVAAAPHWPGRFSARQNLSGIRNHPSEKGGI